jgi:hypothetical protein
MPSLRPPAFALSTLALLSLSPSMLEARPRREALLEERWTDVRPGVRHLVHRDGTFAYHVVTIDLRAPGLRVRSTAESVALPSEGDRRRGHRWTRTSTWARREGAAVAINANYYDLTRWRSACGLVVSEGQRWRSTYQDRRLDCFASAGFAEEGGLVSFFDSRAMRKGGELASWMSVVVSGSPALLREGALLNDQHPRHARFRNPRTAIGLSKDGATLFLMVVDGREGSAQGMTCREVATTLRALGAWNAINLDGGGSSALFIDAEGGVVNHTGEPERPVVNHLGFFFEDSPTPAANPRGASPSSSELHPDTAPRSAPPAPEEAAAAEGGAAASLGASRANAQGSDLGAWLSLLLAGLLSGRRRRIETSSHRTVLRDGSASATQL